MQVEKKYGQILVNVEVTNMGEVLSDYDIIVSFLEFVQGNMTGKILLGDKEGFEEFFASQLTDYSCKKIAAKAKFT